MKIDKNLTRSMALICIFAIIISAFSSCTEKTSNFTSFAMGSEITVRFSSGEEEEMREFFTLIKEAVTKAELELSATDENSEIYKLNEEKLIYASDSLKKTIEDTVMLCTALGDTVDITIGKAAKLWGFSSDKPHVPDEEELKKAIEAKTLDKIKIALNSNKITISEDIEIDMGALEKGIACDRAYEAAKFCEVPYILTLGSTVMAYGEGPSDGKWEIDIRNPFEDASSAFAAIAVAPKGESDKIFVSTSGSYAKSFDENGKTWHHILDPKTGYPAENELASVTVTASSGITADILSTALFIKGYTVDSLQCIKNFSAEAIFVFKDGTYFATEGLEASLKITDSSFTEHTAPPEKEGLV